MSDIAVDYELLNDVARKAGKLKDEVHQARVKNKNYSVDDVGSRRAVTAIRSFYLTWQSAFKRSEGKLEKLKGQYEGVAKQWAELDFKLANDAAKQSASLSVDLHRTITEQWNAWHQAVEQYKKDHPDYKASDLPPEPERPGKRPSTWTTGDGKGNSTTTTYEYGADGKPSKITTKMTTKSGLKASDTTTYHPDGTYNATSTDVYGNVTTTKGTATAIENPEKRITKDVFSSSTKDPKGKKSTTKGTTTSVYYQKTGHRDSTSTYTSVGPDKDGNEQTVHGTSRSSVDLNGHEVITTIEVKKDGSGTKIVVTDGKTVEWTSDQADEDSGWVKTETK
ncbi:hypothetical protein OG422_29205 [Streptomyces sp. NBC_01525]|uniref:hypothetical protein n=1 Tax=Streptomyces sp. NBC_01525 TaxID=2903893 RepID=UPI003870B0ED